MQTLRLPLFLARGHGCLMPGLAGLCQGLAYFVLHGLASSPPDPTLRVLSRHPVLWPHWPCCPLPCDLVPLLGPRHFFVCFRTFLSVSCLYYLQPGSASARRA
eukprot:6176577-Pleurochrysis_carterae.AAC.2